MRNPRLAHERPVWRFELENRKFHALQRIAEDMARKSLIQKSLSRDCDFLFTRQGFTRIHKNGKIFESGDLFAIWSLAGLAQITTN